MMHEIENEKFQLLSKRVLTDIDTLVYIEKTRLSISRFGDGEINMLISENKGCAFESPDPNVTKKLREILFRDVENLLICIPNLDMGGVWWEDYWKKNFLDFSNYVNYDKKYGSAWISRSPIFMRHKEKSIELWRKIWNDRKVIFITGEGSRFNCKHNIFDNVKSYEVIYSKATNATQDIDRLIDLLEDKDKDSLILLSLGVAATILSYELHIKGFQVLDIGHITNCYDKVFHGEIQPEKLSKTGNVWNN